MQIFFKILTLLTITFFWSACGGGSTTNTSNGINTIEVKTIQSFIDNEHKNFYLEFSMKNKYQEDIIAELADINVDLNSCTPSNYTLNSDGNILRFDEPNKSYILKLTAKFAEPCIPEGYFVRANNYLLYQDTSNQMTYQSKFNPIAPETDVIFEDRESLFEYDVLLTAIDGDSKIKLESEKRYHLSLGIKDENRTIINTNSDFQQENVNKIEIQSNDSSKIQLILPENYHTNNEIWQNKLIFDNLNDVNFFVKTFNTSGVVNLDVTINYTNNQGEEHIINTTTSLTVLSGTPTAFSINSAGVEYNSETKWFENKFLISASDKYNNPVNIPSKINIAAMADFRDNYGDGKRILHGKFNPINNKLYKSGDVTLFQTEENDIFNNIDVQRDYLLLFGDVTTHPALGKWDIEDSSGDTLFLRDQYIGEDYENLGFAIGHNYLKEICSSESKEWELKIDSTDQNYELDEEGKTYITLKFPPYLIGKTIALSVNFSGQEGRSGEVDFQTLHSFQGVKKPDDISIDVNGTALGAIHIHQRLAVDTGTEDYWWIKDAGVKCTIETDNIQGYNALDTIYSSNKPIQNISMCSTDNIAFFDFDLKLKNEEKPGSLSFKECSTYSFLPSF